MSGRFSRSWTLVKASAAVLKQNPELMLLPLISLIATLLVIACFALSAIGFGALDGISSTTNGGNGTVYSIAFLFYICMYFVIFFFNSALVGAVMIQFDGGTPTIGDGLHVASSKIVNILGYAIIAATVGMILRTIQERVGFIGKIIVGLLGAGWTASTFMVVPILATRDVGPVEAIKESASLLKKTWGENIAGRGGIGVAFFLIYLAIIVCGIAIVLGTAALTHNQTAIHVVEALMFIAFVPFILIQSTLSTVYSAALYRYASTGSGPDGFETEAMQAAFVSKKR